MNVNEVIAHRANELLGEDLVHPNDHVNCSQSSNDTFPTAMHVAARVALEEQVLPAIGRLTATLDRLSAEYRDVVKIGRTHLQDAVPLTLGQEISGWSAMLGHDRDMIVQACRALSELALGGTAVGTGLTPRRRSAIWRRRRSPSCWATPSCRRRTSSTRSRARTRWCLPTARSRRWRPIS